MTKPCIKFLNEAIKEMEELKEIINSSSHPGVENEIERELESFRNSVRYYTAFYREYLK